MKKKLEVIQEEVSDCGVCSLLSIIKYYGGNTNLEKLRIDSNTTVKGVTALNLIVCARDFGFDAKGLKVDDISKYTFPLIAHLNISKSLSHFVVVYKIKKDVVTIMDPVSGFKNMKLSEFYSLFSGVIIELIPKGEIRVDKSMNLINDIFIKELKSNWRRLLILVILNIIFMILSVTYSFYIDFFTAYSNYYLLFMIFFILLLFISFIEYFISKFTENTKFKYDKSIFKSFYSYLFNLPLNYVHVKNSGEIIKRVNDLEDVNEVITNSFIVILTNTIVIVSIFTVIYFLTKPIFLILIIFCLLFILTAIFLYKQITDKMNMVISSATNYDSNLHDYINGIESINHQDVKDFFSNSLFNSFLYKKEDLKDYKMYLQRISTILDFLFQIFMLIVFTLVFIKIKQKILSINLIIILSLLLNTVYKNLCNAVQIIPGIMYVKSILSKVNDFYSIKSSSINKEITNNYDLNISGLSFSYNHFTKIFNDYNLRIKRGERVMLKGKSGVGKSTLCKIISGSYSNYQGLIKLGNKDIKNINISDYISYSSQDEHIFSATIKENILLGRNISDETFNKICEVCSLDSIIKDRPFGYDTYLYENGFELSGGEKDLIILARALVNNRDIYIFDETLAELNEEKETKVVNNLFEYLDNKTIIYVSHKNKKNYFSRVIYV